MLFYNISERDTQALAANATESLIAADNLNHNKYFVVRINSIIDTFVFAMEAFIEHRISQSYF